jgi:hypothetical protein
MWTVSLSKDADKGKHALPEKLQAVLLALIAEIVKLGPVRGNWPNYSALDKKKFKHHCHLKKKGKPTYVVVWEVRNKQVKIIEVIYVGTHENAPY